MKQNSSIPNDIPLNIREDLVKTLNQQLANLSDLYSQTKQAHWSVTGARFYSLHLLFDTLAESFESFIDEVAERITALGGLALGTARLTAQHSQLPEYPAGLFDGDKHLIELTERYSLAAAKMRMAIDRADELEDKDTADLFTDISKVIDKDLWFLSAHLEKAS